MASQEHQVAVPESGNPDGDVQYFDSELDSDDDVLQTVDGVPNPPSQEGPSLRRRIAFEEMLHLISRTSIPKSLKTERDLILYRAHIARTIYAHSTVEPLVPIPMELL
ncbi:hypothetical protein OROHE_027288 [Orobanche hederae]